MIFSRTCVYIECMTRDEKITYMRRGELLKREGWSPKAIKQLLGEPAKTEPSKKDPSKELRLYLIADINKIEESGKLDAYKS